MLIPLIIFFTYCARRMWLLGERPAAYIILFGTLITVGIQMLMWAE